jgi:hypothetical protein
MGIYSLITWGVDSTVLPWVWSLGGVAWLALILLAIRRQNRRGLVLRLVATTLAMAALVSIILEPMTLQPTSPGHLLVLTAQANPRTVDSLKQEFPNIKTRQWPASPALPGRLAPEVATLHIVGDGLPDGVLTELSPFTLRFYLNSIPGGVYEVQYPDALKVGDTIHISGKYLQSDTAATSILVGGPGGISNILSASPPGQYSFRYSQIAKRAGNYLYTILEESKAGKDTIGQVPIRVRPREDIRIFILNDAPTFETKYLKNWLADAGYPVAVRSTISRGRFVTEFHNLKERSLNRLTTTLLDQFDVLMLPVTAFKSLNSNERAVLAKAVEEGLGLLTITSAADRTVPPRMKALLPSVQPAPSQTTANLPAGTRLFELTTSKYRFQQDLALFPLQRDSRGTVLSGYTLRGQGKRGMVIVTDSYRLLLEGAEGAYSRFWKPIMEGVSRRKRLPERWAMLPAVGAIPHHPLTIKRYTEAAPSSLTIIAPAGRRSTLYPAHFPFHEDLQTFQFWPQQAGWHSVQTADNKVTRWQFWVDAPDAWATLRRTRQIQTNQAEAFRRTTLSTPAEAPAFVQQPFPLWIFYILFLLAAGFLWLEEKW